MLIRKKVVTERYGPSGSTIDRLEKAGRFPKRVRLGHGMVAWVEGELDDWARRRIAERDGGVAK
jgi:prophage regulatory protein